jgi:hypothetical protein
MELKFKNNNKIVSQEKKPKNSRPFSSNPLGRKNPKPNVNSRIKSGLPRLNNELVQNNAHKIEDNSEKFDSNNEFHNTMNFRRTRPKSRYQDKIFNRYWESNATEPKTIFDKNKKKINKLNIETEKDTKEIEKLPKSLNTEITPLDKIMQGDRKLYKFPHINWENKNPNRFLNHVGGINFEFSKTTTMDSSRPSGLNLIINDNNMSNSRMNQNNSRPITAMNYINNNKNRFNRPTTAINKALIRPKTASNYGMVKNNALIKVPQLNMTDSSTNNINPTNISRNMKDIPLSVQTKLEKEIKEKYEYKDQFFNSEEEDKGEEKEYLVDTEILDDFDDNKYATLKSKYEEEKNKPVKYPKVESLMNRFGKMNLQNYSIKTSQADKDLLDIFDRAQKTHASTLGKVGNYEYYSTYQRIGSFMDFSQHLKIEALQKIGRDIYQNRKNLLEFQSKHNIQKPVFGELLVNTCPHFRDSNSLFHGFMPFEEEGQKIMKQYNKSVDIYDPLDFLPKYVWEELFKEEKYSPDFIKSVVTSINNYKKYLDSEKFLMSDLKRFSKSLFKKKIIKKIDITIYLDNNYKRLINDNVNESERLYYDTLKRGIMNYILRSPFERKRLNILFYPNKTLPASYTIAQYGSFNRTKYSSWVNNYNSSCTFLENNLSLCNIAVSGLINWTNSFNHINLIYLDSIHKLTEENFNTIHIDEFCRIQESYLTKVFHFMRDIYYRGAILIIKKNKALKRKDVPSEGKWTFKGFIPDIEEYEREFKDKNYGMNYEDQLRDFWSNINLDNLIDVRITTSNIGYVTYILKKRIDLAVSDYEEMSNEMKIKLNNCVTTYCNIFFRKLTEKALSDFNNFFEKYPSNSELYDKLSKENKINFAKDIVYDSEDDIKFQDLSFFYTSAYVEPLISIKTKYDVLYNLIKLEYNFEQIYEKILKVVDNICTLFNPLCTTHFLEFKKILPSQRENIVKEHSTKLNEFFNSDPNKNKSFLEEYYKTFCPNLILEEIESENYIKSYLNVMGSNELFVNDVKSKIYRKIKLQYSEIEECLKIFEPLRELITNNIDDTIKDFVQKVPPTPDYGSYMKYLKKIRRMKKYIDIIPKKIKYSMFAIDNREVINDLRNKLNANLTLLFKSLEDRITKIYETNNEKFNQFIKLIDVKLTTPEELVQIEKLKIQVNTNFLAALHDYEDSDKILMFLLKEDDVFPLEFSNKICDGIKKFYKFKFEQARIDKMHADNREVLENNFKKERAELEEEMASCHNEINLLDKQTHISDYVNVCAIIKYLQNKVNRLDERLNKSIKDEELLFDYKSEGFDEHNMSKRKLEKYGVLWENIEKFYEERKVLIHNFSEFIEIEHYVTFFNNVESEIKNNKKDLVKGEEVIGKLSKTVEDDIDSITNFLDIMQKVIESPAPLSDDLKKEVIEASENKRIEQSCREILFSYFSKKG